MADLHDVEKRIAELRASIAPVLNEIEALESAAKVLRALDKGQPVTYTTQRDFAKMTMPQAAEAILREIYPNPMHYSEVTRLAIGRGFRGKRTDMNAPREQIASSFRRMMGQRPDIFERVGDGTYRIAEGRQENVGEQASLL
jgi:hypothetical protein